MATPLRILLVATLFFGTTLPPEAQEPKPSNFDFDRAILPILSNNCFKCHGPDAKRRKAGLRLDEERGAKKRDKEGHAAIVPGKSSESEQIRRLLTTDPDEAMPPAKSNKKLTREQIDLLKNWIDAGAPWSEHWAFRPLRKPDVPKMEGSRNPIDAFILARLERESLRPSPPADQATSR